MKGGPFERTGSYKDSGLIYFKILFGLGVIREYNQVRAEAAWLRKKAYFRLPDIYYYRQDRVSRMHFLLIELMRFPVTGK